MLVLSLLAAVAATAEARPRGYSLPGFTFSYPPTAVLPDRSVSFTNNFGTFSWTSHQIEDAGVTPHEQYGMWFVTLTPASGSPVQLTLPNGLGAFAMAQDAAGTVYLEQGDANWGPFLGWTYGQGASSPEPIIQSPGPLDVPTLTGPFTPSSDGTTITAPVGNVTSLAGRWTFGAVANGTDYFVLLNGAHINFGSTFFSATTIRINAQGNAFLHNAMGGLDKVWLAYNTSADGPSTAGPIPVGISFNPSFYSSSGSCPGASTTCAPGFSVASGSNVVGHVISTITINTSDSSGFAGTYQLFPGFGNWTPTAPFKLVGNQIQLNRTLTSADLATAIGGPTTCFVWPTQNGVRLSAGFYNLVVTVVP